MYSKWFYEFSQQRSVKFNHQPIGSGGGIRHVSDGTVDPAATDGPTKDEQMKSAKTKTMHIPTVLGKVVSVYDLSGASKELNVSEDMLAAVYLGQITTWNNPWIARNNLAVSLPNASILPVYGVDGSGTTYIFTDFPIEGEH